MYRVIGGDGREYGPASVQEVRQWLAQGRLHVQSLVRSEAEPTWRPLHTFPELTPPPPAALGAVSHPPTSNPMALWGFVFGLLSLLGSCLCCCACPVNLLAILFSTLGLAQASRERDTHSQTLAVVGLILGILSLVESVVATLVAALSNALIHVVR
ncbi:MAG: DUF4339 domain-containing protein [Verrucomicrobiae bacterium]|nr:DUF4339 domain-containing protein [Verrucomicrobiae bacterium]